MKILIIDNYDSFTFNLVHLLNEVRQEATVWRNDQFQLPDVEAFEKIILSPGPGLPSESGLLLDVIQAYASKKSILGICLGMQAIAEVFGWTLYNLLKPVHGKATTIHILENKPESLFSNCPQNFKVGRYHSWAVNDMQTTAELEATAVDDHGVIMALRHTTLDIRGVQFHPESILTEHGKQIIANWCTH